MPRRLAKSPVRTPVSPRSNPTAQQYPAPFARMANRSLEVLPIQGHPALNVVVAIDQAGELAHHSFAATVIPDDPNVGRQILLQQFTLVQIQSGVADVPS